MAKVNPIPDGYPQVIPYLIVDGAAAAIDFYAEVFGAKERMRMPGADGKVGHAELEIGQSMIMLADKFPGMDTTGPAAGSTASIMVYVPDVDDAFARALKAGAKEVGPLTDQFYGDRSGQFDDPFGHRWSIASHVEDVSEEEMGKRAAAAMQE